MVYRYFYNRTNMKTINFVQNEKKMHLETQAELCHALQHLQNKYGDIKVHSVYTEDGSVTSFDPMKPATELYDTYPRHWIQLILCVLFIGVCYVAIKWANYRNY